MSKEIMNVKEVSQYLGIHKNQIYRLIRQGVMPAARAAGKWVFPRRIVDLWIESSAMANLSPEVKELMRAEFPDVRDIDRESQKDGQVRAAKTVLLR
jgi:excisionase family DNA binding protein